MSIVDEKRVKFTSFDSYYVYNVLCLTFRRNPRILIKRKILEVISRKNRGPTKPWRTDWNKVKDHTVVHHAPRSPEPRTVRSTAVREPVRVLVHCRTPVRVPVCWCMADHASRHGCAFPGLRSCVIFRPLYIVFSSYFGGTSWLGFQERQLGFMIPPKTPLGGD